MSTPEVTEMQVLVLLVNTSGTGSLERVLGLLRRRAPAIAAMNVTASADSDLACVTVMMRSTQAAATQVAEHLRKLVDVRDCALMHSTKAAVAT